MTWYPAPGKLNLFLHVLGLRADGYHELQTVFRLIDRCDRVGISLRSDAKVRFEGLLGEENLCLRAARLLQRETHCARGCDLRLEKHLPVGGGLGGGSSDAATVLLVLNRLWQLNLSGARLREALIRTDCGVTSTSSSSAIHSIAASRPISRCGVMMMFSSRPAARMLVSFFSRVMFTLRSLSRL